MTCNVIATNQWEIIFNYLELPSSHRAQIKVEQIEKECHITGYLVKDVASEMCAAKIDIPLNATLFGNVPPSPYVTFASMDSKDPQICLTIPHYLHSNKIPVLLSLLHTLDPKQFPVHIDIGILSISQRLDLAGLIDQLLFIQPGNNIPYKKL